MMQYTMYICFDCYLCFKLSIMSFYSSLFFFFKQKTAYEMRISDWSSDVCSSDLYQSIVPTTDPIRGKIFAWREYLDGGNVARKEIGRASCRESVCQYV